MNNSPQGWRWLAKQECATARHALLAIKATELSLAGFNMLTKPEQKRII
jgi:hypothetical protein